MSLSYCTSLPENRHSLTVRGRRTAVAGIRPASIAPVSARETARHLRLCAVRTYALYECLSQFVTETPSSVRACLWQNEEACRHAMYCRVTSWEASAVSRSFYIGETYMFPRSVSVHCVCVVGWGWCVPPRYAGEARCMCMCCVGVWLQTACPNNLPNTYTNTKYMCMHYIILYRHIYIYIYTHSEEESAIYFSTAVWPTRPRGSLSLCEL